MKTKFHRLHFHTNAWIMNTCEIRNLLRHLHKFTHYINNICMYTVDPIKLFLWHDTARHEKSKKKNIRRNDKKWNGMEKSCHLIPSAQFFPSSFTSFNNKCQQSILKLLDRRVFPRVFSFSLGIVFFFSFTFANFSHFQRNSCRLAHKRQQKRTQIT